MKVRDIDEWLIHVQEPEVQGIEIEGEDVTILVELPDGEKNLIPGKYYGGKEYPGKGQIRFPSEETEMTWDQAQKIQDFLDRNLYGWVCQGPKVIEK